MSPPIGIRLVPMALKKGFELIASLSAAQCWNSTTMSLYVLKTVWTRLTAVPVQPGFAGELAENCRRTAGGLQTGRMLRPRAPCVDT